MTRRQRSRRADDAWEGRTCERPLTAGTKAATPSSVPFSSTQSKRWPLMSAW